MEGNKYGFQKLTPINTANIEIYREAINFAFEEHDLRNIALSGAYSAGKSSILESYKKEHKNIKFLHISLAHFESADNADEIMTSKTSEGEEKTQSAQDQNEDADKNDNMPFIKESVLEGKILNQLIHQIHPKRIPQTNFRVKHRMSFIRLVSTSILLAIVSLAIIHTIFFNAWKEFVNGFTVVNWATDFLMLTIRNGFRLALGFICVFAITALIYKLIKMQINKGIVKRLGNDKLEIEIFKDSDDSYFDKYLNEVLYLFERSKADVIVFEDMDRYNSNRIFQRLREVNTLINVQRRERAENNFKNSIINFIKDINSKVIKIFNKNKNETKKSTEETSNVEEKKKIKPIYQPLRFLYLLRDDIFVSKERTKFFDYIVPVIPVMDGSNSYDQFIKHLKQGNVFDLFDEAFLSYFSLYIDDMRILKNIYNEFMVYYNRLKVTKPNLSPDKMLAMIAYKNLFPRDFNETQIKNGFVSALFDKKQKDYFIKIKKDKIETQLQNAQSSIDMAKKELLESLEEWKIVYEQRKLEISRKHNSWQPQYQEKLNELELLSTKRKAAIQKRLDNDMSTLERDMLDIKAALSRVFNEPLRELITDSNIVKIFSISVENDISEKSYFTDVRGNPYFDMLKYLVRNGFIDETYSDYMTYFYPESLSQNDKVFLLSISNQIPLDYAYNLDDCNIILKRINILSFDRPETLNFNLLFYLLENQTGDNKIFLDAFFNQLQKGKKISFIQEALSWTKDWGINDTRLILFVNQLNSSWNDFIKSILGEVDFLEICRDRLILLTFYHTPEATLKNVNIDNCLTAFISGKEDFLKIYEPDIPKLIERFELLEVCFEKIDYDASDKPLFEAIYENNLYAITFNNISQMLTKMYGLEVSDDFKHKNYTLILTNPQSPLAKYVDIYLDEYINIILDNCDDKITDYENIALQIVNNNEVAPETKKSYLNKLETIIEEITAVTDKNMWNQLVDNAIIRASEVNIIEYYIYCGNKINTELIKFVNENNYEYDYKAIRANYSEKIQSAFFDSVLECNKLNNKHYEEIITSLEWSYNEGGFAVENISDEKMLILIKNKIIFMLADSLLFIRENYPDVVLSYIKKNTPEYIGILDEKTFDFDEMLSILSSDISNLHKLEILKLNLTDQTIPIINKNYADEIKAYIISEPYFESKELRSLLISYPKEGNKTKSAIEVLAINKIASIYTNEFPIVLDLFQKIHNNSTVDINIKIKMFVSSLRAMNEEQCKVFIPQLSLDGDYLSVFDGKRPKIKIDDISERILSIFLEKGWITKYEPDEKEPDYYRVISKRVRSEDEHTVID